jgi:hypothetical protein
VAAVIEKLGASDEEAEELLALAARPRDPSWFLEEPADLDNFRGIYEHLQAAALTPADTRELINQTIKGIEGQARHNDRVAMAQE